nr:hypothetical protein AOJQRVMU_AOJQRVMU_CDS_0003 [Microvirus sp.]
MMEFLKKIGKFIAAALPVLAALDAIYHRLLEVFDKE